MFAQWEREIQIFLIFPTGRVLYIINNVEPRCGHAGRNPGFWVIGDSEHSELDSETSRSFHFELWELSRVHVKLNYSFQAMWKHANQVANSYPSQKCYQKELDFEKKIRWKSDADWVDQVTNQTTIIRVVQGVLAAVQQVV